MDIFDSFMVKNVACDKNYLFQSLALLLESDEVQVQV